MFYVTAVQEHLALGLTRRTINEFHKVDPGKARRRSWGNLEYEYGSCPP